MNSMLGSINNIPRNIFDKNETSSISSDLQRLKNFPFYQVKPAEIKQEVERLRRLKYGENYEPEKLKPYHLKRDEDPVPEVEKLHDDVLPVVDNVLNFNRRAKRIAESMQSEQVKEDITPFHLAAGTRNLQLLAQCLAMYDVDCKDKEGRTPLVYAVIAEDFKAIDLLAKNGADLDSCDIDGRTSCHWASFYGKHQILKHLVKLGANWTVQDNERRTSLHWAAGNPDTKCLSLLLERSSFFDINQPDAELMTPILWAVYHSHLSHVELLLKYGASINTTDLEGKNALHWCSPIKDITIAKLLVEKDPKILTVRDLEGRTPLHLACAENNVALVQHLVSFDGCDLDAVDRTSRSALHWAAVSGHHQLVNLLLSNGAKDSVKDSIGATPLHYACSKNHAQCVAALITNENRAYLPDNEGRYALTWAVTKGHVQSVRFLLQNQINTNYEDNQGSTALHAAANAGQTHCLALLLEHGAKVDALDKQMHTPLFRCVEKGYAESANILIQAHANVEHLDGELRAPLHFAALCGHLPVVSLLLANGASIDRQDSQGRSALHFGAIGGHNETVKYLLECGATVDLRDGECLTALHRCAMMGHAHTVELLITSGSDVNATNKELTLGTPWDYAIQERQTECVVILEKNGGLPLEEFIYLCAVNIQRVWRGHFIRRQMVSERADLVESRKKRHNAAIIIQRRVRDYLISKKAKAAADSALNSKPTPLNNELIEKPEANNFMGPLDTTMDSMELEYFKLHSEKKKEEEKKLHLSSASNKMLNASASSRKSEDRKPGLIQAYQAQLESIQRQQEELDRLKRETEEKLKKLALDLDK